MVNLNIYNSLTKQIEEFIPVNPPNVSMYTCGFTVYDHTHIGHIKKYVGDDILKRVLMFNGYKVKHVQNVTDVGHLDSDADTGEDKMEKGANKYKMSVIELARMFEKEFYDAMDEVNVIKPDVIERAASDKSIDKQIKYIQVLLDNGYAYIKNSAIYFDVSKLDNYNPFSKQKLEDKLTKREDVEVDPEKKHQADFVVWMFRKGKYANHSMYWNSPWGEGFPGWHIECSAIGISNLGEYIDIHTGGIDHLEVHHPDEIAQNYGITGHDVVKYWVHHNFLTVDGKKMSKSLNNFYTLQDIKDKGYNPMALRYFVLTANYRSQINFTWDTLMGAQKAYDRLLFNINEFKKTNEGGADQKSYDEYRNIFLEMINDDFNITEGLALLWEVVQNDKLTSSTKLKIIEEFDKVFGLNLINADFNREVDINMLPENVLELYNARLDARKSKNYNESDRLREQIEELGYTLNDDSKGTAIYKK